MANSAQAKKRARQAEQNRQHNTAMRSSMRSSMKKVMSAIESGDQTTAQQAYRAAVSSIDTLSRKGLIHPNKGARHKSHINRRIRAMQ